MLADKSSASRFSSSTIRMVCATPAFLIFRNALPLPGKDRRVGSRPGKRHAETGATARLFQAFDPALMSLDDGRDLGKAKPRALGSRREEGVENAPSQLGLHAGAVVGDLDRYGARRRREPHDHMSAALESVHRVDDEVEDGFVELVAI